MSAILPARRRRAVLERPSVGMPDPRLEWIVDFGLVRDDGGEPVP